MCIQYLSYITYTSLQFNVQTKEIGRKKYMRYLSQIGPIPTLNK